MSVLTVISLNFSLPSRIIESFINSLFVYDDHFVIYYNVKDGKQVSYVEMLDSTSEPGTADFDPDLSFKSNNPRDISGVRFFNKMWAQRDSNPRTSCV